MIPEGNPKEGRATFALGHSRCTIAVRVVHLVVLVVTSGLWAHVAPRPAKLFVTGSIHPPVTKELGDGVLWNTVSPAEHVEGSPQPSR